VALSCDGVVLPKLHLEENEHFSQMLLRFQVVDLVDLVLVRLPAEVILNDELLPDLDDFLKEGLRFLDLTLLSEKVTHIVIRAAHTVGLRTMLNALKVDTLRQVL
jgi:hypothetical protein